MKVVAILAVTITAISGAPQWWNAGGSGGTFYPANGGSGGSFNPGNGGSGLATKLTHFIFLFFVTKSGRDKLLPAKPSSQFWTPVKGFFSSPL